MEKIKLFFNPSSVAVLGATDRKGTAGKTILENLLHGSDSRKIYPVNPNREEVLGLKCYPDINSLPELPELAVIATPAKSVADLVEEIGKAGVKAIIIISAGFKEIGADGQSREDKIAEIAAKYDIRIMGPNCMGTIRPSTSLNTTFASIMPKAGNVAFLSQSGALGSAVLDWATSKGIGFSAFVSLGSMLDINFGDLIDYFGEDPETRSIIIYMESIANAKKFMSAARGFARTKPIIVLKAGKFQEGRRAAKSHTGAMVGEDLYYDAIFRRAGVVRVEEIEDLFNCASILNTARLPKGPNLAIVTNAGGPSVLATDTLIGRGGKLAQLSKTTINSLNNFLPTNWSKFNPIDILGDSDSQRYAQTMEVIVKDPGVDGIIVIYTPQGRAGPTEVANAIIKYAKSNKPILAAWMGNKKAAKARQLLYDNKIPAYEFPEEAIRTYLYMYQYARNLESLYETPEELPLDSGPSKNYLKTLIRKAVKEDRTVLTEENSKKFLTTYGISAATAHVAKDGKDAVRIASQVGYPVVMKISSPDITHKSDAGGIKLNISSADEVQMAFSEIIENARKYKPDAAVEGVSIQKMITNYDYELIVGGKKDLIFGPVIMFGLGGIEAEFFKDIAVGLPPLNQVLARRLLEQTKIYKMLSQGFRKRPPVDLRLLEETLVKFSNLLIDFPEITETDINPLIMTSNTAIALDARIILDKEAVRKGVEEHSHLIISPYPTRYVQPWRCRDGRIVLLRPIKPEDELLERELIAGLSEQSMRFRFFHLIKDITHEMLTRYCNIDYDREMAIIAEYTSNSKRRNVGVGRLMIEPSAETGEFAVLVADDFQGSGLGLKLTDMLIGIAHEKKLKSIYGITLRDNTKMLRLAQKLGFMVHTYSSDEIKITLEL